jgi:hypothetical protein
MREVGMEPWPILGQTSPGLGVSSRQAAQTRVTSGA